MVFFSTSRTVTRPALHDLIFDPYALHYLSVIKIALFTLELKSNMEWAGRAIPRFPHDTRS
jgi:hypothetical protein